MDALALARKVREALLEKKGEQVVVLDVRGLSDVTDFYVLATGNNGPHLRALMDAADGTLGPKKTSRRRQSGSPQSAWMVIDCIDVVVHVFTPEARGYYALELLWGDAKIVE